MQRFIPTLLLLLSPAVFSQKECSVVEQRTGETVPCKFPFILNGTALSECTDLQDPDGKKWCSTKTTDENLHVGNGRYWGYCEDDKCTQPVELGSDGSSTQPRIKVNENDEEEQEIIANIIDQLATLDIAYRQSLSSNEEEDCPCQPHTECPSLARLIRQGNRLRRTHPVRTRILEFLKTLKCEGKGRLLRCCDPAGPRILKKAEKTTIKPAVKEETTTKDTVSDTTNKDSGTWEPDPASFECGLRTFTTNVVGGNDSTVGELPFMALLAFDVRGTKQYGCGGSLINKKYVLTAAHCFNDKHKFPLVEIALGEVDLVTDPDCSIGRQFCAPKVQRLGIESIIIHPAYNRTNFKNDIALVRLSEPALLFAGAGRERSLVSPVCLPWRESDPGRRVPVGQRAVVAGWGRVTNNLDVTFDNIRTLGASTRNLQKLDLPVLSRSLCASTFASQEFEPDLQMCAGAEAGKDSCNGDSGGPLFTRARGSESPWFQIGIVSYGTRICGQGTPGAYTRVTAYLDWIRENVRE